MKFSSTKNAFWVVNIKKWRKWLKFVLPFLLNNTYGLSVFTMETNFQFIYFMLNWSSNRLFVLNTGWKRDFFQTMLFVYICSSCSIDELKALLETWITRNDVNGLSLFHLSYLITLMAYLCSQSTPNFQNMYFMFEWWFYRLFVLNMGWKRDSLQIIIFVNVCLTWS
jgi:hypothetical protein